jgi:hypothetical protein
MSASPERTIYRGLLGELLRTSYTRSSQNYPSTY